MIWLTRTLGDICDEVRGIIRTGPFGSQLHQSDYRDEGLPVIMPKDITDSKVSVEGIARIGDEDVKRLSQHRLEKGDIVYGRRGDIGRRALITEREAGWLCGTGCLRISLGSSIVDPVFLYYYLGESKVIAWIYNQAIGATLPNLNTTIIRSIRVNYPPLPTQRKIAAVLSAYDRLIENNTRRIKILEEMARSLYDEWFVKFRCPGYEQTEMVDSELGLIPEGWQVVNLRDVSSYINRGISPKYDDQSTSIVINQKCIRDCRLNLDLVRRQCKKVPQEKFIQFGDVLVNSTGIGTLGRVAQVYQNISECTVDSHVSIVRSIESINIDYFGFSLFKLQAYFDHSGVGSTGQTELSRESIANAEFLLPPKELQQTFGQAISPMRHTIINLFAKNANLRKTRDLLLPKLISGEIDVENLDIETWAINGNEEVSSSSQEAIAG